MLRGLPRPTDEFRKKSWLAFQTALDRHLLGHGYLEPRERLFSA